MNDQTIKEIAIGIALKNAVDKLKHLQRAFMPSAQWVGSGIHDSTIETILACEEALQIIEGANADD